MEFHCVAASRDIGAAVSPKANRIIIVSSFVLNMKVVENRNLLSIVIVLSPKARSVLIVSVFVPIIACIIGVAG